MGKENDDEFGIYNARASDLPVSLVEQAVLCSCLASEECIECGLDANLQPTDFSVPLYADMWAAITAMYANKVPIDEVTMTNHLVTKLGRNENEMIISLGKICSLIDCPTVRYCKAYVAALIERSKIRKLRAVALDILAELGEKTDKSASELISQAEDWITALSMNASENDRIHPVCDLVPGIMAELQPGSKEEDSGILTGIHGIDACLHGLKPGQVFILAARPGIGKTALALNIASNVSSAGTPTLFISLEMTADELMTRLVASHAGVNLRAYREGFCARGTDIKLHVAAECVAKYPLTIDDYCSQGMAAITSTARRMQRKYGIRFTVIDYLQLINPRNPLLPREQQIAEVSRGLKFMAKNLNMPVLCLAQLNRSAEIENRMPRLSDLRESGTIEQDADIVAFIDRSETGRKYPEAGLNMVERDLIIAKNRSGATARVELMLNRGATLFRERTPDTIPEPTSKASDPLPDRTRSRPF